MVGLCLARPLSILMNKHNIETNLSSPGQLFSSLHFISAYDISTLVNLQSLTDELIKNPTSVKDKFTIHTQYSFYYSPRFEVYWLKRLHKRRSLDNHRRHIEFLTSLSDTPCCDLVCVTIARIYIKSFSCLVWFVTTYISQAENGFLGVTRTSKKPR